MVKHTAVSCGASPPSYSPHRPWVLSNNINGYLAFSPCGLSGNACRSFATAVLLVVVVWLG
jgi:hypothetical protein